MNKLEEVSEELKELEEQEQTFVPFKKKDIHPNAWNRKDSNYIEISNKEFTKAFNEVNTEWIKGLSNI